MKQVDVPTLTGSFGILPAHVPTLQVLRPGVVTIFSDDGASAKYFGELSSPLELQTTGCSSQSQFSSDVFTGSPGNFTLH